jgi:hypothetical protein
MLKLKITVLSALALAAVATPQIAGAQSNEAKLAAARACDGQQYKQKGYNSYQECTADYIAYYPGLPPTE